MQKQIKEYKGKTYYKNSNEEWFGVDKNNKEYKVTIPKLLDVLNKEESVGLGDTIKKITSAVGIEACQSCEERKKVLNALFPYSRKKDIVVLNEQDLELMEVINKSKIIKSENVDALFKLYNKTFSEKLQRCSCPGLVRVIVERLNAAKEIKNN